MSKNYNNPEEDVLTGESDHDQSKEESIVEEAEKIVSEGIPEDETTSNPEEIIEAMLREEEKFEKWYIQQIGGVNNSLDQMKKRVIEQGDKIKMLHSRLKKNIGMLDEYLEESERRSKELFANSDTKRKWFPDDEIIESK